jgi:hypothetical protein
MNLDFDIVQAIQALQASTFRNLIIEIVSHILCFHSH